MNLFLGDGINFWDVNGLGGIKSDYQNDTWYNVILIKQNDLYKVYINGVVDMETNVNNSSNYNNIVGFAFGTATWKEEGAEYFNGKLDDIGIWNRALDSTEIQNLYSGSACTYYDTVTVIVYDTITYYDTVLVSVTDTLIIDVTLTGITPPNNTNTIKVYPNPTNDQLHIDNGDYLSMSGYTLKIVNSVGQDVFNSLITTPLFVIDISTLGSTGLYFIQVIDGNNNVLENRKLVLE